jgi:dihydroorotase-like cyclic amidohydrolase
VYDLLIRDGTVVSSEGRVVADVAVLDGCIAYVGPRPPRGAREEVSAIGRFVLPGAVELGARFEDGASGGWAGGTALAAAAGVTSVVHVPWGPDPVVDVDSADRRAQRARQSACDWATWVDAASREASACGGHHVAGSLAMRSPPEGPRGTVVMALDDAGAIEQLADAASGLVHLLGLTGADAVTAAGRWRAVGDVTVGVALHALIFADDDPPVGATAATGSSDADRRTLWAAIRRGQVDAVSSHVGPSLAGPFGGHRLLAALLAVARQGRITYERVVALCCEGPARVIGAPHKGVIRPGADADLVLWREGPNRRVAKAADAWSGREVAAPPDLVYVRGRLVARSGAPSNAAGAGRPLGGPRA